MLNQDRAREFLNLIRDPNDVSPIVLIGHSMGGRVLTYALRDLALIRNEHWPPIRRPMFAHLILLEPDINSDYFNENLARMRALCVPVTVYTSSHSQFLVTGDVYYFTDANGNPAMPAAGLIEDPNPRTSTNNFYNNDHFSSADPGSTGVAFTNCSDDTQPGVQPILSYLHALPYPPFNNGNCSSNHWYQLNNDYPYYTTRGTIISNQDVNEFPAGPAYSIGPRRSRQHVSSPFFFANPRSSFIN